MRFPEVCCVGLSTQGTIPVRNTTQRWLHAYLQVAALSVDGQDVDPLRQLPFVMREKVIVEPGTCEDVKVRIINLFRRIVVISMLPNDVTAVGAVVCSLGINQPCDLWRSLQKDLSSC